MELIKDTLKTVLESLTQGKGQSTEEQLGGALKKYLTKKEISHIKVNYFRKGTLSLNVDSSSWLYHLSLKKEAILADLRAGNPQLKELRFYIGETVCPRKKQSQKRQ